MISVKLPHCVGLVDKLKKEIPNKQYEFTRTVIYKDAFHRNSSHVSLIRDSVICEIYKNKKIDTSVC